MARNQNPKEPSKVTETHEVLIEEEKVERINVRQPHTDPQEQPVFDVDPESSIELTYGVEERPDNFLETLFYAFQITLVDFTPFIWSGMFVALAGLPESVIVTMISTCFLAMGVGTLIQTTIGNRLPIVQGPSSSVLTAMGNVTAVYGFPAMWGAVLVGGLLEFIIGTSKIFVRLESLSQLSLRAL